VETKRRYVADTVGLARFFEDSLPSKADRAFKEAEDGNAVILIPEIVTAEFVYIALRGRLKSNDPKALIQELLGELDAAAGFRQVGMTRNAWTEFLLSEIPELHDRMIHAIAKTEEVDAIITNDREIASSGFRTIW
jgi:predicted nucleic acid-binding protein